MNNNTHIFAFYTEFVNFIVKNKSSFDIQEISDQLLVYRITSILRLDKDAIIILFNSEYNITCRIIGIEFKKKIVIELVSIEPNITLEPKITALLPLIKKEALESAIYSLTQLGIQNIQFLITEKTHKFINVKQDHDRLKKIMIAAAEQSKQFVLPNLFEPVPLEIYLMSSLIDKSDNNLKIFFDKSGDKFLNIINAINSRTINHIFVLVGPEGDLTEKEKFKLSEYSFNFCALTKTILRTPDAILLGFGTLRSFL